MEFMDDTGASMMFLGTSDVKDLHAQRIRNGPRGGARLPPIIGRRSLELANGESEFFNVVLLEVNYNYPPAGAAVGYALPTWKLIQVAMVDDSENPGSVTRLAGPWLRSEFFTATVPDGKFDFWITDMPAGLVGVGPRPPTVLKPLGKRPELHRHPLADIPASEARDY